MTRFEFPTQEKIESDLGIPDHVAEDIDPSVPQLIQAKNVNPATYHFVYSPQGQLVQPVSEIEMAHGKLFLRNHSPLFHRDYPDLRREVESR